MFQTDLLISNVSQKQFDLVITTTIIQGLSLQPQAIVGEGDGVDIWIVVSDFLVYALLI